MFRVLYTPCSFQSRQQEATSLLRKLPINSRAMSTRKIATSLPFSGFLRKLEQDLETVVKVLQPGPLGIIEHKFSDDEIREAETAVRRAVINWRRRAKLEKRSEILKDYVD